MFGNLAAGGAFDAADEALSRALRRAWVAFAASGDPNGPWLPAWSAYRAADDNHLVLAQAAEPGGGWRRAQLDFLDRFHAAS